MNELAKSAAHLSPSQGKTGGRQGKLDEKQGELAVRLYNEGGAVKDTCQTMRISKPTFSWYARNAM